MLKAINKIQKRYTSNNTTLKHILNYGKAGETIKVNGWVKTARFQKKIGFVELVDGTNTKPLQLVIEGLESKQELVKDITTGCSLKATGDLILSPGKNQSLELSVSKIEVIGKSDPESYPLQKKKHGVEFLRENGFLRSRTSSMAALIRIRALLLKSLNQSLASQEFIQVQTPILTSHDCEGGGEVFQVTTEKKDFFNQPAYLTVSSQLHLEMLASSINKVYTIGPTFRAEGSLTNRHLAEFWMAEVEWAFINGLDELMDCCEKSIKEIIKFIIDNGKEEIALFNKNSKDQSLTSKLNKTIETTFERITYDEAIQILQKSDKLFQFKPENGNALQSEHEKYLVDEYFKKPIFITHYPKSIKPFYMKLDNNNKVLNFDLLIPGIGELVGGSLREDNFELLEKNMKDHNITDLHWYLELRKYGSTLHGGFGLGIERLLQYITEIESIRDVSPYPRYIQHCRY